MRRIPARSPLAPLPVIQRANRAPRPLQRLPEGRHIASIPLDYYKNPAEPKTPSVTSHGSVLEYVSPSFPPTVKATLRAAIREHETRLTELNLQEVCFNEGQVGGRVASWLEHTAIAGLENSEGPYNFQESDDVKEHQGGRSPFYVRPHTREASADLNFISAQTPLRRALQDVSNLRNPGENRFSPAKALPEFVPSQARVEAFDRTLAILEGRRPERTESAARQASPVRMSDLARNLAIIQGGRRR